MTIALKNNETGTVNVNGTDRTIVTPLVTAVGVIFGQDATNVVVPTVWWKAPPRAMWLPLSPCRA